MALSGIDSVGRHRDGSDSTLIQERNDTENPPVTTSCLLVDSRRRPPYECDLVRAAILDRDGMQCRERIDEVALAVGAEDAGDTQRRDLTIVDANRAL